MADHRHGGFIAKVGVHKRVDIDFQDMDVGSYRPCGKFEGFEFLGNRRLLETSNHSNRAAFRHTGAQDPHHVCALFAGHHVACGVFRIGIGLGSQKVLVWELGRNCHRRLSVLVTMSDDDVIAFSGKLPICGFRIGNRYILHHGCLQVELLGGSLESCDGNGIPTLVIGRSRENQGHRIRSFLLHCLFL